MDMVEDGLRLSDVISQNASVGWHQSISDTWTTRKDAQQNAEMPWSKRLLSMLVSTGLKSSQ